MSSVFGPDVTFLGVEPVDLSNRARIEASDIVIIGAPFDGGTTYRPGARFGPSAIRTADVDVHNPSRPHISLKVDPLRELRVVDAGDVLMPPGETELSMRRLEDAVAAVAEAGAIPLILGGDHTIALPNVRGVARGLGSKRIAVIHFDAHADTADVELGSGLNHATSMRRLIESGAVRGDRFIQIGLRGYWPPPEVFDWMATQGMRWMDMDEVVERGLNACLDEAIAIAQDECDAVFLSIDVDVVDPSMAPGTGTPEPGGITSRQLLDAVRRCALELPVAGLDVVEVAPVYDSSEITAYLANRVVLEALSGITKRRRG